MINWRRKDFNSPPRELYNLIRLEALRAAEDLMDGDQVKSNHYNFPEVKGLLKAYSIDKENFDDSIDLAKCFYCESTPEVVASLQVEHYRPKKAIHNNERQIVVGTHGYYWLGLEWSNLVLSCPRCNGRSGKGNIFTISGVRVKNGSNFFNNIFNRTNCLADSETLIEEQADLLHPEIDDSYVYLRFDTDGQIHYKQYRGKRTIEICRLDRKELFISRNKLVQETLISFLEIIGFHSKGFIAEGQIGALFAEKCDQLFEKRTNQHPYSLLVRYMIEDFESFFVQKIDLRYQDYLRIAFQSSNLRNQQ